MRVIVKITPGDILKEDFMEPMGITQYRLAKTLGVSAIRISELFTAKER